MTEQIPEVKVVTTPHGEKIYAESVPSAHPEKKQFIELLNAEDHRRIAKRYEAAAEEFRKHSLPKKYGGMVYFNYQTTAAH
jgi:hypothetical protein